MPIVDFARKTYIPDFPELSSITNDISMDVSYATSEGSTISSQKFCVRHFSDISNLLTNAAANRYYTEENELSAYDLNFFNGKEDFTQDDQSKKEAYFELYPIVEEEHDVSTLVSNQLLTKNNIEEFESYMAGLGASNAKLYIPVYNPENESPDAAYIDQLSAFIPTTKNEARATYKFEYNSRESNEIDLSKITPGSNKIVYYSVFGLVSIKSIIPDQKSGTIYLEARDKDDNEWRTIDSVVFKFTNESNSPGTYVSLSGYLSSNFKTRLKLNLHPQAYSMNIGTYRFFNDAFVNKYVNTFVGFAYYPN